MKLKLATTFLLAALLQSSAFANNNPTDNNPYQFRGRTQFNSWFASANVGAQAFIGDHDKQQSFGKRITPNFELGVGKWFNESFGARVGLNGFKIKGLTKTNSALAIGNEIIGSPHFLAKQEFNFLNFHADVLFHWTNDAYGADANKMYNLIPYAGFGVMSALNHQKVTKMSFNLGLIQSFKVNDNFSIDLDVRGNIVGDSFDGENGGNKFEGNALSTIGVTYTFK